MPKKSIETSFVSRASRERFSVEPTAFHITNWQKKLLTCKINLLKMLLVSEARKVVASVN